MIVRNGMTREDYERERYLDEQTERFHKRTGKAYSTDEAVRALNLGRRKFLPPPKPYWEETMIRQRTYARHAVRELIRRMDTHPDEDPIRVIYELLDHLDDMIVKSENRYVWTFADAMTKAIYEILDLLS